MADAFSCYAIDEVARVSNDGPSAASLAILAIRQVILIFGREAKKSHPSNRQRAPERTMTMPVAAV
jgi:hypothetical protein